MIAVECIRARGHPLVQATHRSTLEITCDPELTKGGDCIIAVNANKGAKHLSPLFKRLAADDATRIVIVLVCNGLVEVIRAWGHSGLTFESPNSLVVRRSSFIDGRTVAVKSDKAAINMDRRMIALLQRSAELKAYLFACSKDENTVESKILELFKSAHA
ncbi:MAG: DUF371 domain-containing protein [Thermofilaceae archaeon]